MSSEHENPEAYRKVSLIVIHQIDELKALTTDPAATKEQMLTKIRDIATMVGAITTNTVAREDAFARLAVIRDIPGANYQQIAGLTCLDLQVLADTPLHDQDTDDIRTHLSAMIAHYELNWTNSRESNRRFGLASLLFSIPKG